MRTRSDTTPAGSGRAETSRAWTLAFALAALALAANLALAGTAVSFLAAVALAGGRAGGLRLQLPPSRRPGALVRTAAHGRALR
ncbi:protein of unknown function [Methylorubrum extorquens]|uniref:Uncharacterized protein n=1 Tax=Methylorubrum extorquens TaxID=408 RepID=A0A2N9AVC1_METEX|nr:protein of unknown function [Methylorubrum extorquens]